MLMSVTGDYIFAGVDIHYMGGNHRFANVHWAGDQKFATNVLGVPSTLLLEANLFSFEV
jgi:hypothetical protein